MLMRAAPLLFVLLWSTGFIGSKLGAADAEPFTFLSLRFLLVLAILVPIALVMRRQAGGWRERGHAAMAGTLIHGLYLGGVLWALRHGMPAGVAALIVSLQPLLTSVLSGPLLGERPSPRHWFGLALGLAGAVLILAPKLDSSVIGGGGITPATVCATAVALAAITAGTLYQKRFAVRIDLLVGAIWQYIGALAIVAPAALLVETREVNWTPQFMLALGLAGDRAVDRRHFPADAAHPPEHRVERLGPVLSRACRDRRHRLWRVRARRSIRCSWQDWRWRRWRFFSSRGRPARRVETVASYCGAHGEHRCRMPPRRDLRRICLP